MKALVLTEYNRFEYQDVAAPEAGPGEVLIEVRACGICGSDVHGMDGSSGRRRPPIIMGHEAAGVIAAVGDGVTEWDPGRRVTFDSTVWCGTCRYCRRGDINLCDHRMVLGVSCDDYRRHGAFAEYVSVPQQICYRLPEGLPLEHAAMVEAISVAVHAANRAPVALGDTAVVVGSGRFSFELSVVWFGGVCFVLPLGKVTRGGKGFPVLHLVASHTRISSHGRYWLISLPCSCRFSERLVLCRSVNFRICVAMYSVLAARSWIS